MIRIAVLALAVALSGCSSRPPVPEDLEAEARAWVAEEIEAKNQLAFSPSWLVGGHAGANMVCGEFTGIAGFVEPVKFVYSRSEYSGGVIEPHLVGLDILGSALAAQTEAMFDQTWTEHCEPFRPSSRWPFL